MHETEFNDDVLRLLKKHQESIDDKVRFQEYRAALGKKQEAIEELLILVKDTNSDVRQSAANALGRLANPSDDVVQQLLLLLKDSDDFVRGSAAEALGNLANKSDNVVVAVEKWLEEEQDSEYKEYGVMALWYLVVGKL